jgi:hypothetical protein
VLLVSKKGSHLRVLDEEFVNISAVADDLLGCAGHGRALRLLERLDTDPN